MRHMEALFGHRKGRDNMWEQIYTFGKVWNTYKTATGRDSIPCDAQHQTNRLTIQNNSTMFALLGSTDKSDLASKIANSIDIKQVYIGIYKTAAVGTGTSKFNVGNAALTYNQIEIQSQQPEASSALYNTILNPTEFTLNMSSAQNTLVWVAMSSGFVNELIANQNPIAIFGLKTGTKNNAITYDYLPKIKIQYEYKRSTIGNISSSAAKFGVELPVTLNLNVPQASESQYTHKISFYVSNTYKVDDISIPVGSPRTTSYTYTIPESWCQAIPNDTSTELKITLKTIGTDGTTLIGTDEKTVPVTIPSGVKPSAGSIVYATNGSFTVPTSNMPLRLSLSGASGIYGSSLTSVVISFDGYSVENSQSSIASTALEIESVNPNASNESSRSVQATATVYDSRGRSHTVTRYLTVYAWDKPYFSSITVERCTSDGTVSATGTYAKISGTYACYSVNGQNALQNVSTNSLCPIKVIDTSDASELDCGNLASGTPKVVPAPNSGNTLSTDKNYKVQLTLKDKNITAVYTYDVFTAAFVMHFKNGGTGVAFGQAATEDNTVRINPNWNLIIGNNVNVASTLADLLSRVTALEGGNS